MGERRGMKALELWCRRVTQGYPGVKVENMTTSWRDGLAFCAIIHHFRPDLIDFSRLDKSDIYGNNELAFRTAERHLGIPSLLDAEDMLEYPVPDRLSILTYLSLFYQAFASNGSSPMKRSAESNDGSLMIVPQSVQPTPTKVTVGSGREPCAVCNLPVFIAQRLRVSDKLFHRTCFRCARCDNQLSPADYYETHDGRYCCEVCPDEMKEQEDGGGGEVADRPETPPKEVATKAAEPEPPEPPPPTPLKPSLVNLRRMMFESYSKDTDDAKQLKLGDSALSVVNSHVQSSAKDLHTKDNFVSYSDTPDIVDCVNKDVVTRLDEEPIMSDRVVECISPVVNVSKIAAYRGEPVEPESLTSLKDILESANKKDSEKEPDSHTLESLNANVRLIIDLAEDELESESKDYTDGSETLKSEDNSMECPPDVTEAYNPVLTECTETDVPTDDDHRVPSSAEVFNYTDNTVSMYSESDDRKKSRVTSDPNYHDSTSVGHVMPRINVGVDTKEVDPSEPILMVTESSNDDDSSRKINTTDAKSILMGTESIKEVESKTSNVTDSEPILMIDESMKIQSHRKRYGAEAEPISVITEAAKEVESGKRIVADRKPILLATESVKKFESSKKNNAAEAEPVSTVTESIKGVESTMKNTTDTKPVLIVTESTKEVESSKRDTVDTKPDLMVTESIKEVESSGKTVAPDVIEPTTVESDSTPHVQQSGMKFLCDDSPGNPFDLEEEAECNSTPNQCVNRKVVDTSEEDYPDDLNPFAEEGGSCAKPTSTNPFGSDSEEEKPLSRRADAQNRKYESSQSLNPFFSDGDEEDEDVMQACLKKPPVPLPRRTLTPEPSPMPRNRLRSSGRSIGSVGSLAMRRKKQAPQPPSPSLSISSLASTMSTPRRRKLRRAPAPPSPSSCRSLRIIPVPQDMEGIQVDDAEKGEGIQKEETHKPHTIFVSIDIDSKDADDSRISEDDSFNKSEGEKPGQETHLDQIIEQINELNSQLENKPVEMKTASLGRRKRIKPLPVDYSSDDIPGFLGSPEKESRTPPASPTKPTGDLIPYLGSRGEASSPTTEKKDKDSANLQVQSTEGGTYNLDKSAYGQWKRKKGPAPSVPFPTSPERRVLQPMPILKLKQELEDIEVKQQGLERQGVALEKRIREKFTSEASVTPYVEELVLQLFELVNEKNDLFRKQAELMYLRRQFHLEEEHAELEYQIRCLMARPEANKTDSDKELEELLIQRLIEVVERRDAIVQCLERDRLREAEEDKSVNAQLNKFSEAVGTENTESKIEKRHKKNKKDRQSLSCVIDLDKDIDETVKEHKKKKKWFTLHHSKTKH